MDPRPSDQPAGSLALRRALALVKVDGPPQHRPPSAIRLGLATVGSIAGSLAACAVLVVVAQALFPSTKGYGHFQFADYGKLTVVGVIVACVAWPFVAKLCSAPRWLFFRMAILVTLVLWLPDLYILAKGQPPKAVAVLMVMHLAIAVVTYNLLVRVAPVRSAARGAPVRSAPAGPSPSLTGATAGSKCGSLSPVPRGRLDNDGRG